jgi:DNA processing protein
VTDNLKYTLALGQIDGIGPNIGRKLIRHFGDAQAVFKSTSKDFDLIKGAGRSLRKQIQGFKDFSYIEQELDYIEKNNLNVYEYNTDDYPKRLNHCTDGPLAVFSRGIKNLNHPRALAIVGTRMATDYGKTFTQKLISELAEHNVAIYSGLAYGIDIAAHRAALKHSVPTVGVVAHGLDRIYPSHHKGTAHQMTENGAIVSEFFSGTVPNRENFPMRNRIIAGLVDAVLVVESKRSGGAMITAELGNSYNRDVFALPGRVTDLCSEGCNLLIKSNRAAVIQSYKDLEYIMNWSKDEQTDQPKQVKLFVELAGEEERIFNCLQKNGPLSIDKLCLELNVQGRTLATHLLNLQLSGMIKTKPGGIYDIA